MDFYMLNIIALHECQHFPVGFPWVEIHLDNSIKCEQWVILELRWWWFDKAVGRYANYARKNTLNKKIKYEKEIILLATQKILLGKIQSHSVISWLSGHRSSKLINY